VEVCAIPSADVTIDAMPSFARPALEELYRAHFDFVWRSVRALGVDDSAIDDVVQEVFVVAQRRLPTFEGRSSPRTWLSGILLNVVRRHRRTAKRKSPHELSREPPTDVDSLPTAAKSPHEVALANEGARLLQRVLGGLDEKKREVLVLAELEEFSAPEIAEVLGIGLNTVYSRLRIAREEFERIAARYRARERDARRPR
jgi:RNA polymerase sigma-70 factor, ECF subfamily